jgi:hypothetical protein
MCAPSLVAKEKWSRSEDQAPYGCEESDEGSRGCSRGVADARRQVLDAAISGGHFCTNAARNRTVTNGGEANSQGYPRKRAEPEALRLSTRKEFVQVVHKIPIPGVSDCKAAAGDVQFIAFSGARKTWSDTDFSRERIHLRVTKNGESQVRPD